MRVIKCDKILTVILSEGRILQTNECTDELFEMVKKYCEEDNEFEMINLLVPEEKEEEISNVRIIQFWDNSKNTKELTVKGDSVYWESVSQLSMPMSFAEKVMDAEKKGDTKLLNAYRNFWTLLSLNPDAEVRKNLFKFLDKWGMVITKSGLFVGYRNVASTAIEDVYTDQYSRTMTITIGKMVTLPREQCDCNSSVSCSRGLHIGGTSWLNRNYFGNIGLVCLVNPVDVVAVPWQDEKYGKLRTCAYLPIAKAVFNEEGHIIPFKKDSGFEEPFVSVILYDGVISTEENAEYVIPLPKDTKQAKTVSDKILAIAKEAMRNRQ